MGIIWTYLIESYVLFLELNEITVSLPVLICGGMNPWAHGDRQESVLGQVRVNSKCFYKPSLLIFLNHHFSLLFILSLRIVLTFKFFIMILS